MSPERAIESAEHGDTFALFVRTSPLLAGIVCVLAFASGCAVQRFLRIDERAVDARLRFFLGGGGNSLVLTHGAEAFLVDAKFGGASQSLRARVEDELAKKVRRVLLTHSHLDHTGGLHHFESVGAVLVHPNARRRLEAEGLRANFIEVTRPIELLLGDEVVRVWSPGVGHTDGDLVAYLTQRKVLVTGDLLSQLNEPLIDEQAGGDALALEQTIDGLLTLDFVTALPGHGDPIGRDTFVAVRDYLAQVRREVEAGQAHGWSPDEVVAKVQLAGAREFEPVPFRANREKTIRAVDRALRARAAKE